MSYDMRATNTGEELIMKGASKDLSLLQSSQAIPTTTQESSEEKHLRILTQASQALQMSKTTTMGSKAVTVRTGFQSERPKLAISNDNQRFRRIDVKPITAGILSPRCHTNEDQWQMSNLMRNSKRDGSFMSTDEISEILLKSTKLNSPTSGFSTARSVK
jgi:hypothetical protein